MTEAKIKTPTYFDIDARTVYNADDHTVCDVDAEGLLSDADADALGNQIVTALNRQSELEAEVAELARYKAMVAHPAFCGVQMWSWSPWAYDQAVEISTDGLGKWRWFDPANDGQLIAESPVCDTLLEAVEALAAADTARGKADDDCGHICGHQEPYGFVPEDGCPIHDTARGDNDGQQ